MKKIILYMLLLLSAAEGFATTPARELITRHEDIKGARMMEVSGGKMAFVRPILKRYPIGKMADAVMSVTAINLNKASAADKKLFLDDMKQTMRNYRYYGKSEAPEGYADVYVHMLSEDMVDELVTYNLETCVMHSLTGDFPVKELLKLDPGK